METAIVLNSPSISREITETHVICADGGYKNLRDVKPSVIVGDMDSISHLPNDIKLIKLPTEKNLSDGEFAVRYAHENGFSKIVLYGILGGRIDHVLCNLALMKLANSLGLDVVAKEDGLNVHFVNGECDLSVKKGTTISILPYAGEAIVTSSQGLYYPLENLTLTTSDTRGLSNVATAEKIHFSVTKGDVLVFQYI
ncbi:MAG: thiamine diphosphokinase [Clostridia bacterium]|nr:thiamine diphosphokinase [Clostridia bacterium]